MKETKLNPESIKWIKENPKEFTEELIRKSELVKNFSDKLEPYRKNNDRIGGRFSSNKPEPREVPSEQQKKRNS